MPSDVWQRHSLQTRFVSVLAFSKLFLPDFDIEQINRVLGQRLEDLEAGSRRTCAHTYRLAWKRRRIMDILMVCNLWIALRMEEKRKSARFVLRSLMGVDLIAHYRAYFSQEYDALKELYP